MQCDNFGVQQDTENNYINQHQPKWIEESISSEPAPKSTHKIDSGSIDSYDSGIITSPITSHASANSNVLADSLGSATSNSKNASNFEIESDKINANSIVPTVENRGHFEDSDKTTKLNDACTKMALAIYQG